MFEVFIHLFIYFYIILSNWFHTRNIHIL
uniref:Uncharacterized protein n=1 Tax=Anguilla anguilla TaxID=7936 RepID=A0A0E9SBY1_ANGAN